MKKGVITAFDVNTARKAGRTSLSVPEGTLVTPQAADDARSYGITLHRDVAAQASSNRVPPQAMLPVHNIRNTTDEVRRQVIHKLGGATPPLLDAVIASVMTGAPGAPAGENTGSSLARKAEGVTFVSAAALPAQGSGTSSPDAVSMMEAAPPDAAHPGVAYMSWENTSFSWSFQHAEVLVVLEGEITLTADNGAALVGKPGDAFRIAAQSSFTLAAKGKARCIHSSWPNPPTLQG